MVRSGTIPFSLVAWVLCVVLTCMAVHTQHCDLSSRLSAGGSSLLQLVVDNPDDAPDTCNGICQCCEVYRLPDTVRVTAVVHMVDAGVWPESAEPAQGLRSMVFRPPRVLASA
jgi:hypothetical protein